MHLTGGLFKGRIISAPKGGDVCVRPTLSKVRESVFNILSSHFGDFSNLSFLDMFTGSGIMALEAYSRGFKNITAIEKNPKTWLNVKKTYSAFENADSKITLLKGDSLKILSKLEKYDVIYIDPPWDFDYTSIIFAAFKQITKNGIVIVEYDKKNTESLKKLTSLDEIGILFKEKTYGRTKLDFYKK